MKSKVIFFHTNEKKGGCTMKDITLDKKREIEDVVTNILSDYDFSKDISVDIVTLVRNDGFLVQNADMPIDVTGYLAVNDKNPVDEKGRFNRLIVVNTKFRNPGNEENVVLKKSRFITAHEYGHFILHKKDQELYAHRDSDKREKPEELEADYFARSILMPMKQFSLFNQVINSILSNANGIEESDLMKVRLLSTLFKVTTDKVKKRLGDISEFNTANA